MRWKEMKFDPQGVPAPEKRVRLAEQRLGIRFPADYRAFLLNVNGGYSCAYRLRDNRDFRIHKWFSILDQEGDDGIVSLELANERLREASGGHLIVVGSDIGNRYVVVCTVGPQLGKVGILNPEVQSGLEVVFEFPSFKAFLSELVEHPEQ